MELVTTVRRSRRRRRITYPLRRSLGDLFLGPYSACSVLNERMQPRRKPSRLSPRIFTGRRHQARRYVAPSRASRLDGAAQPKLELRMP